MTYLYLTGFNNQAFNAIKTLNTVREFQENLQENGHSANLLFAIEPKIKDGKIKNRKANRQTNVRPDVKPVQN